jgi:hypothetical protein
MDSSVNFNFVYYHLMNSSVNFNFVYYHLMNSSVNFNFVYYHLMNSPVNFGSKWCKDLALWKCVWISAIFVLKQDFMAFSDAR